MTCGKGFTRTGKVREKKGREEKSRTRGQFLGSHHARPLNKAFRVGGSGKERSASEKRGEQGRGEESKFPTTGRKRYMQNPRGCYENEKDNKKKTSRCMRSFRRKDQSLVMLLLGTVEKKE